MILNVAFLALFLASQTFAATPSAQYCGDGLFYFATEQCDDGKPPRLHNFGFEANLEGWTWGIIGNTRVGTGDNTEFPWPIPQGQYAAKVLWEWGTPANISLSQDILIPESLASGALVIWMKK